MSNWTGSYDKTVLYNDRPSSNFYAKWRLKSFGAIQGRLKSAINKDAHGKKPPFARSMMFEKGHRSHLLLVKCIIISSTQPAFDEPVAVKVLLLTPLKSNLEGAIYVRACINSALVVQACCKHADVVPVLDRH